MMNVSSALLSSRTNEGSQYRVESMMLRIAHKLNYVAFSATQKQKQYARAAECLPLTLEPESGFYEEPVAVLDFQSLYPSVIIAYNMCFTTCLGRVESLGRDGCFKFGCGSLCLPDDVLQRLDLHNDIYVTPNGVAFVKRHIRVGVLPTMLEDILATRLMVKHSMKIHKHVRVRHLDPARAHSSNDRFEGREFGKNIGLAPAQSQAHRQRHLWIHSCQLFGAHALRRSRRFDRACR